MKGRPLLQPANTTWTPEKSIEDLDRAGSAAAVISITNVPSPKSLGGTLIPMLQ